MVLLLCSNVNAGVVITGFSADGNGGISIGVLENFGSGTTFRFRDDEWDGSAFSTGEGAFSFTFSNSVSAGTLLRFDNVDSGTLAATDGFGNSVAGTFATSGSFNLSASNEGFYVYQGTDFDTVTRQLASLVTDGGSGTLFNNADGSHINFDNTSLSDVDVASYSGPQTTAGSFQDFVGFAENVSNWTEQGDGSGDQSGSWAPPTGRLSTVPEPATIVMFGSLLFVGLPPRRRAA